MENSNIEAAAKVAKIGLIILTSLITFSSCEPDPILINSVSSTKLVRVINKGNSPELFISFKGESKRLTGSDISIHLESGTVITALGTSYSVDNSKNYGGTNFDVVAEIVFKVNGLEVKKGVAHLTYKL